MMHLRFLLILLLATPFARADLGKLLESPTRPTMEQVQPLLEEIKDIPGIPVEAAQAQAYLDKRVDVKTWLARTLTNGPMLLARLEGAFPGATWVFLGRDALSYADLFEAFYLSIGQSDRVERIGISKATQQSATEESYVALLKSHGFDLKKASRSHPYVLIDPVSGGNGRQGRALIAAAYDTWLQQDHSPATLVDRLFMVGLIVSTFQGQPNDISKAKTIFEQEKAKYKHPQAQWNYNTIFQHMSILTIPEAAHHANESGYTHFAGAWHDSFGTLAKDSDGDLAALPGIVFPIEMRRTILWTQREIWNAVKAGDVTKAVRKAAKDLGYEFPFDARPAKDCESLLEKRVS